jgi:hypothetical protein
MRKILATFLFALTLTVAAHAATQSQDAGPFAAPLVPTAATPIWGKLVLSGNTVTCYYGTGVAQPTTWTQAGKPTTISFINNPILVGMFICSHDSTSIASGTIDNFSITPTPTYRLADTDIGAPSLMGSANLINGVWNLAGSGADIWTSTDQFNFQPWLVWGDCTVICRITSLNAAAPWSKIGIMIRDGYNSGSDYAMFCATGAAGVDFQWRNAFNNNPDSTQLVAPPAPGVTSSVAVGYSLAGPTAYVVRP